MGGPRRPSHERAYTLRRLGGIWGLWVLASRAPRASLVAAPATPDALWLVGGGLNVRARQDRGYDKPAPHSPQTFPTQHPQIQVV